MTRASRLGPRASRARVRRRRAGAAAILALVVIVVVVVVLVTSGSGPPIGHDVSYPQCATSDPSDTLFGIVGVNGGLANDANPCLARQLRWAQASPGQRRPVQSPVAFYIDTGNPGAGVADWPRSGTTPADGACNAKLTDACSYLYGRQRALADYRRAAALEPRTALAEPWWLDVEEMASWAGTYQLNLAALKGYIAGLRAGGARAQIGIYSTAAQWRDLTGLTPQNTRAVFSGGLPDWIAGTEATLAQASRACAAVGFTGESPQLAQYQRDGADADLRCGSDTSSG